MIAFTCSGCGKSLTVKDEFAGKRATSALMSRNSRWSDAPVLDRAGRPKTTRPTQREVEALFPILDRYPPRSDPR